jgi:DNA-binding NtrC family response regulator
MQILVIDDDAIIIKSCIRILESEGFGVSTSRNADEAPEIIRKGNFDLLLIDVKMPKRDGLSLVKEIRQDFPKLPIIVMSGYPTTETIADVVKSGATQFIAKPFKPDELIKLIRQILPT